MKIPTIVVDDEKVDRYTAKRRIEKHGGFGTVHEAVSGDAFLEEYCSGHCAIELAGLPLLILIDVNMPGRNGFETIAELEIRQKEERAPPTVVVTMVTSSTNPRDKAAAERLALIRGYALKPLDAEGTEEIFQLYQAVHAQQQSAA